MFENFIVFTEVVKLSSDIFWRMREVNYHDKFLKFIRKKQDVVAFEEVVDIIEDKCLVTKFGNILTVCNINNERKWIENIFKVIDTTILGNILLTYSSRHGFIDFVKYLIERPDCKVCSEHCCHGANIHAQDNCALRWAARSGHLEIVKYLVEKGANINAGGNYAFGWASSNGHLGVVKYLVGKGVDIHSQGYPALMRAANWGHLEIVNYLKMKIAERH